jgi:hypothetical protein
MTTSPLGIQDRWSAVLDDVFHAMNWSKVPVQRKFKKAFYTAIMNAFFAWDMKRLQKGIDI